MTREDIEMVKTQDLEEHGLALDKLPYRAAKAVPVVLRALQDKIDAAGRQSQEEQR